MNPASKFVPPKQFQTPEFIGALKRIYKAHQEAVEKLTQEQFTNLVTQMVLSGDIVRYVMKDGDAQQLMYIPFKQELQSNRRYMRLVEFARSKIGNELVDEFLKGENTCQT